MSDNYNATVARPLVAGTSASESTTRKSIGSLDSWKITAGTLTRVRSAITETFETVQNKLCGLAHDALDRQIPLKFLSSALLLLAAEGMSSARAQTISVKAELNNPGPTIPPNFIGFSSDTEDVVGGIYSLNNTSLISLLQLLGPNGVMRVGGDGEESMPPNLLTQEAANDTAGFLNQLGPGWSLLYGLPDDGNTSDAVQQAGYLLNALGSGRVAFQVSNEPDLHYQGNEQAWLNTFNSDYSALTAAYGPLNYGAPDTSQLQDLSRPQDTSLGESGFQRLTTHKYWPYACNPLPYFPSANSILDDARVVSLPGWSLTEFGIICDGGYQGITDRLIAATYYLRLAQSAASGGWASIMPHNVIIPGLWGDGLPPRPAYYNQFAVQPDGGYAPKPMFYGMYLFAQTVGQQMVGVQTPADFSSVASITATTGPNGNANIMVVNINPRQGFYVRPDQTTPWQNANVLVLSGRNCADPAPVLNGQPIGEGGAWPGSEASINRGNTVYIPPCGATLIKIQS